MRFVQIHSTLSKSRNPTEHGFRLQNEIGTIIQSLEDGYCLIKFEKFQIKKKVSENRKTKWIFYPLEWYLHKDDFTETNEQEMKKNKNNQLTLL